MCRPRPNGRGRLRLFGGMGGKLRSRVDFSGGIPYNITQVSSCRSLEHFARPGRTCRSAASAGRTEPWPRKAGAGKGCSHGTHPNRTTCRGPGQPVPPEESIPPSPSHRRRCFGPLLRPVRPGRGEHHLSQRHRQRGLPGGSHRRGGPGRPHRGRRRPDRSGGPRGGLPGPDPPGGGGHLPGPPGQRHHRRPGLCRPGLPGGPRPALPPAGGVSTSAVSSPGRKFSLSTATAAAWTPCWTRWKPPWQSPP